ncbi:MAG: hypothetical protein P9L97_04590 [Candidatus Tenebribacter davisii]|nr:hypothetical protein [Candidatus Tenebribacter davisii]
MKRIIVIMICILIMSFAFSDELEMDLINQTVYTSSLSLGFFSTLSLGIGPVSENQRIEKMIIVHAGLSPFFFGGGIYFQNRYFKDSTRTGMFYTFNIGIDHIAAIGGRSARLTLPNIAGGIGYSKKIGDNSYFRISIDLGIKAVISNLNLSITF